VRTVRLRPLVSAHLRKCMKRSAPETLRVQIFVSGSVAAAEIASKLPLAAGCAAPRPAASRLGHGESFSRSRFPGPA
jgi:hypothetical protein